MFAKDAKPISTGDGHQPAARQGVPSLISQDMRITGDLVSDGDIQVDGTKLPLTADEEGELVLRMFWMDTYEDPFKQPGYRNTCLNKILV